MGESFGWHGRTAGAYSISTSSAISTQTDPRSSHRFGERDSASVSATVAALEDTDTDAELFETICQIRGDELADDGAHEVVHRIRGKATPEEQALGSFTRRKLKQLPIWDAWLASEWLQLDSHQKQGVFGAPCPAPPGATVVL